MYNQSQPQRSVVWAGAFVALLAITLPLSAQEQPQAQQSEATAQMEQEMDFTMERFEKLQDQGALILIDIYADWCPTCKKQQEILANFREQHPKVELYTLTVNFDKQKKWVKHFNAPRQSTFILFRGTQKVWFSVAETRASVITEKLLSAVRQQTS